jgi:hypothetical protein
MTFQIVIAGMFPSTGQPSGIDYLDGVKPFAIRFGTIPFKFEETGPFAPLGHQA